MEILPADVLSLNLSTSIHNMEFVERRVGAAEEVFTRLQNRVEELSAKMTVLEAHVTDVDNRLMHLVERTWHNALEARKEDRCYVNDTDYPVELAIGTAAHVPGEPRNYNACGLLLSIDDRDILWSLNNNDDNEGGTVICAATATVPPGASYRVNANSAREGGVLFWWELRAGEPDQIGECR